MADITPQMVKDLREKTGAGMADCKKALSETNGDMNAAIEYLRKKGAAAAAKRTDRTANEGMIATRISDDAKTAAYVEVTCETDFVSRNEGFTSYVESLADVLFANNPSTLEEFMALPMGSITVQDAHNEILAKFSEKIDINRFEKRNTDGSFTVYTHGGSKLVVVVEISASNLSDSSKASVKDIAMQIAAMNPQFLDRSSVDTATLEKEIEIYKEQAIQEGKNPEIAAKVAQGRVEKFYKESCLVEQAFVKDTKMTISDVVAQIAKDSGVDAKIVAFSRIAIGA